MQLLENVWRRSPRCAQTGACSIVHICGPPPGLGGNGRGPSSTATVQLPSTNAAKPSETNFPAFRMMLTGTPLRYSISIRKHKRLTMFRLTNAVHKCTVQVTCRHHSGPLLPLADR